MIPAVREHVPEAVDEQGEQRQAVGVGRSFADLELARFVLRHRHDRLESHALAKIREDRAQGIRKTQHEFLGAGRDGRGELRVHHHRVAVRFALAGGLREDLFRRREGHDGPGHGLAVGLEAESGEELLAPRFDGAGQASWGEHQRIEILDRGVLGQLAEQERRHVELHRQREGIFLVDDADA